MRRPTSAAAVLLLVVTPPAAAQGKALEARYGRWEASSGSRLFEGAIARSLAGPLWLGLGGLGLVPDSSDDQGFYGAVVDVTLFKHTSRFGPYLVAGTGVGALTGAADEVAAIWSAGGGIEWNPFAFAGLSAEVRYRALDPGVRGFWRLDANAPRDLAVAAGVTIRWSYRSAPAARRTAPVVPPARVSGSAAEVVQTALAQMGAPYRWGGTDANGFDCSGLIQYAYREHGVTLPRSSAEQARAGREVPRELRDMVAGDLLAFSAVPGGQVTHVGMYVGESKFIHSARQGVTLSVLSPEDPDGAWWWERWVGVRRVVGP